jgi:phosphoribosylformylglycinamidine synthase
MSEACEVFGTPVVSGNVSLYNETDRGPIYPTPTVGMVGVLEDVERHASPVFKREGDLVAVIGAGSPVSLDGSEYLEIVHGRVAGRPPRPDLGAEKKTADLVRKMVRSGLVDTAHDISGGGEIVAVAELALAGGLGIEYGEDGLERMTAGRGRADVAMFGEGGGAFVIAVPEERLDEVQIALAGFAYDVVGTTGGDRFEVGDLIDLELSDLREAYERDLFESYAPEGGHIG